MKSIFNIPLFYIGNFIFLTFLCTNCQNNNAQTNNKNPNQPKGESVILNASKILSSPEKISEEFKKMNWGSYRAYEFCKDNELDFTMATRFVRGIYHEPNKRYKEKHPETEWFLERLPLTEFAQILYYYKEPHHKTFMDVGSGNGDKLLMAMCYGFSGAYGVEYEKKLHDSAEDALKEMTKKKLIEIQHGDATKLPVSYFQQADFLYMFCPLVLDKMRQAELMMGIVENMREGTLVYEAGFMYAKEFNYLFDMPVENGYRGFFAVKKEKGKYYFRIFVKGWEEFNFDFKKAKIQLEKMKSGEYQEKK